MYLVLFLLGFATSGLLPAQANRRQLLHDLIGRSHGQNEDYTENLNYPSQLFDIIDHHLNDAITRNTDYEEESNSNIENSFRNCRQESVRKALERLRDDEHDDETNNIINLLVSESLACREKSFERSGKEIPSLRCIGCIADDIKNFVKDVFGIDKKRTFTPPKAKSYLEQHFIAFKNKSSYRDTNDDFEHEVSQQKIDLNKIFLSLINYFNSKKTPQNSQTKKDYLLDVFRTIEEYLYHRNQSSAKNKGNVNNDQQFEKIFKRILELRNHLAGAGEKQFQNSISQVIKMIKNNKKPKTSNIHIVVKNEISYLKSLNDAISNALKEHVITNDNVGFFSSVFKDILNYARIRNPDLDYDNLDLNKFEEEVVLQEIFNSMLTYIREQNTSSDSDTQSSDSSESANESTPGLRQTVLDIKKYLNLVSNPPRPRNEAQIYLINIFKLILNIIDDKHESSTERPETLSLKQILDMSIKFRNRNNNTHVEVQAVKQFINLLFKEIVNYQRDKNEIGKGNRDIDLYFNEVVKAIEIYLWKLENKKDATSDIKFVFKKVEIYLRKLAEVRDTTDYTDTASIVEMIFNELLNFSSYFEIDKGKEYDNTPYLKRILSLLANFNMPKENGTQKALTFLDRMFDAIIYYRDTQISKSLVTKAPLDWGSRLLDIVNAMDKYRKSYDDNSVTNAQLTLLFKDIQNYLELYNPTTMKLTGSQYVLNQILEALLHFYYKYSELLIIEPKDNNYNALNIILKVLRGHTISTPLKETEFQKHVFSLFVKYRKHVKADKWGSDVIKKSIEEFYKDISKYLRAGSQSNNETPKELLREDIYFDAQNVRFLITELPKNKKEPWFFQNLMSVLLNYRNSLNYTIESNKADKYIRTLYEAILNNNPIWHKEINRFSFPSSTKASSSIYPDKKENIHVESLADLYLDEIFKIIDRHTAAKDQTNADMQQILKVIIKYLNYKNRYPFIPITYRPKYPQENFVVFFKKIVDIIINYRNYDINTADINIKNIYYDIFTKPDKDSKETALAWLVKLLLRIYSEIQKSNANQDTKTGLIWIFNIIFDHIKDVVNNVPDSKTDSTLEEILVILKDLIIKNNQKVTMLELLTKIISELNNKGNEEQIRMVINIIGNFYKIINNFDWNDDDSKFEILNFVKIFEKYLENIFDRINNLIHNNDGMDVIVDYKIIIKIIQDVIGKHHHRPDIIITDDLRDLEKILFNLYEEIIIRLINPVEAYKIIIEIVNKMSDKNLYDQDTKAILDLITVIIKEIYKYNPEVHPPGDWDIWKKIIDKIINGHNKNEDIIHIIIDIRNATHVVDVNEIANKLTDIIVKILLDWLEDGSQTKTKEIEQIWKLIIEIFKNPDKESVPQIIKTIIKVIYDVWIDFKDKERIDLSKYGTMILQLILNIVSQVPPQVKVEIKVIIESWNKVIPTLIQDWQKIWVEIWQYVSNLEKGFVEIIKWWMISLINDYESWKALVSEWIVDIFGEDFTNIVDIIINIIKTIINNNNNNNNNNKDTHNDNVDLELSGQTVITIDQYVSDKYKKCYCCEELTRFKAKLLEKGVDIDALEAEIEADRTGNNIQVITSKKPKYISKNIDEPFVSNKNK